MVVFMKDAGSKNTARPKYGLNEANDRGAAGRFATHLRNCQLLAVSFLTTATFAASSSRVSARTVT